MRSYIHEHQTEFIPAGLDPAAVADAVQEPSSPSRTQALLAGGEGDEDVHRAREQERDQRGLQWAYDTLEGTLSVARQSFAGAIELLRDAWDSYFSQLASSSTTPTSSSAAARTPAAPPSTSTVLYAAIAVLVISNLWTLTLVGKAPEQRKDPQARQSEEREKWVHGIVTALWHELEAGRQPGAAAPSPTAASDSPQKPQQQPVVPPAAVQLPEYWHEEVAQLRLALDTVEERVRAVRQSLAELD